MFPPHIHRTWEPGKAILAHPCIWLSKNRHFENDSHKNRIGLGPYPTRIKSCVGSFFSSAGVRFRDEAARDARPGEAEGHGHREGLLRHRQVRLRHAANHPRRRQEDRIDSGG